MTAKVVFCERHFLFSISVLFFLFCASLVFPQTASLDSINLKIVDGQFKEAIADLNGLIREDSLNFQAFCKLGYCYQALFKHDSARVALEEARKLNPGHIQTLLLLGGCYDVLGRPDQAVAAHEQVLQMDPLNQSAGINAGKSYLELGKYRQADSLYQIFAARDSTNSYFYKQLGICAQKMDSLQNAASYFRKSFRLNNKNVAVMLQLSGIFYQIDQLDSALRVTNHGLEFYPNNLHLLKRKAEILFKERDYQHAISCLEQVVKMENASALTYKKLGMCYFFTDEATFALLNLLKSYQKDSTDGLTCFYLGLAYKEHKLYERSVLFLTKAGRLSIPDYMSDIYTQLAASLELTAKDDPFGGDEQFAQAIQSYKKGLEYKPDKKILTFYLASVYDQYYADRKIPLLYYQKFLRESGDLDEKLTSYAESRIKAIKQEIHFKNGTNNQ